MVSTCRVFERTVYRYQSQGSVVSAIGNLITTIVTAVADLIILIVNSIVSVSVCWLWASSTALILDSQVLVLLWDLFVDILCCRCCSGRRRVGTRRRFGSSSRWY
jgi:hypothetical protein